jgi:hypothetical protein
VRIRVQRVESHGAVEPARTTIGRQAMSKVEKTSEDDLTAEEYLEVSSLADMKVPPMIQKAIEKHRRDLPELMKRHADQWVAYHGDERLEFGRSQRALYHKYLDRGLKPDELIVLGVEPELPDEVELDSSEWAHV